ncbi:MAG: hypothetical protein IPL36_12770 [Nigerium sp.]|nr:hypothetical protein [Nigerium sp.]
MSEATIECWSPVAATARSFGANAFETEVETARWLVDLLAKLGRESDAYDAVGLVIPDVSGAPDATSGEVPAGPLEAGVSEDLVSDPVVENAVSAAEVARCRSAST